METRTNETRINATASAVSANATSVAGRLRAVAAHSGTAQLRSETGRLVKALASRLNVTTSAGHEALAEYSLLLAAVEGTVSEISADPTGANATSASSDDATASAVPRGFHLLDTAGGEIGVTPLIH
uniref:Uncharacterized protein n=1 Tax=Neobodo designis TaxID=312471 RepID=A0A7S1L2T8_NEODS